MKKLVFILLLFTIPAIASAQSRADYEKVMSRFRKCYNEGKVVDIVAMFSEQLGSIEKRSELWDEYMQEETMALYGLITGTTYLGYDADTKEPAPRHFKVTFKKTSHTLTFTLDKNNKFLAFQFKATEDGEK